MFQRKRGQVTIFIILAIVIVGFVLVFFAFRTGLFETAFSSQFSDVSTFVQDCIDKEAIDVVYQVGDGGGYYFSPNLSTSSGIAYYSINGKILMPSKEDVEKEISYYLNQKLFFCTKNFVDFPNYEIIQGEIDTKADIRGDKIVLNVNYPVTVSNGGNTERFEDFKTEIPVRMGTVYDSIYEFMNSSLDSVCLSCLLEIAEENDLYVDMLDYDDETIIFIFSDENSKINDKTFAWVFAGKYSVE